MSGDDGVILTPEAIIKSVQAGLFAERKALAEANLRAREAASRIKKAERLLKVLRRTFNIPDTMPSSVAVPTNPKPIGVSVIDSETDPEHCPVCGVRIPHPPAMAMHIKHKHKDYNGEVH